MPESVSADINYLMWPMSQLCT